VTAEWSIDLPGMPPISANRRGHWARHADDIREWRPAAAMCARAAQVPHLERVVVTLHCTPPDQRRRDRDNVRATLKPIIDGLVDVGVITDDTPDRVVSDELVLHPADGVRAWRWRLEIHDAACVHTWPGDLTDDAVCAHGCGLRYGEWSR
jgi:crossover junction endodeoxyribonuclease RusA